MSTHHLLRILALAAVAGAPLTAVAASTGINAEAIQPFSQGLINVINGVIVPVLLAIAFLFFLWGLYKYFIWNNDNESEKMEGRKFAMWGIIGFAIIFSVWGLVSIVKGAFTFTSETTPKSPTFQKI